MGTFHGSSYRQIRQDTPKTLVLAYWWPAVYAAVLRLFMPAVLAAYLQLGQLSAFSGTVAAAGPSAFSSRTRPGRIHLVTAPRTRRITTHRRSSSEHI